MSNVTYQKIGSKGDNNPFDDEEMRIIRHSVKVAGRYIVNKEEQAKFWALLDKIRKIINKK